jgi:LPXTG-site transpeptidase (sortase) family protein
MFREGASLLKVGVVMAALALVLVVCAVVVSVALRTEPRRAATEVARNHLGESPWTFSGTEGSAAERASSEGETRRLFSSGGEGSPKQGPSFRSGGSVGQGEGESREAQRAGAASEAASYSSRSGVSQQDGQRTGSQAQRDQAGSADQLLAEGQRTASGGGQGNQLLPAAENDDWPKPSPQELQRANSPRHYELLPGAVMGLTIEKIGIYDAPVFDSDGPQALANGVAHVPGTSWPWSSTPQRNVYLAGHRMGFRGTWSRMLFYNLDKLQEGDKVVLRDRSGDTYEYRVSEVFLAEPTDAWVMGQVRGRDMLTLQTCTPLYTFEKRLIVRADRV